MAVAPEFLTFLFTDVEGSTALWERHPAAMEQVLAQHDGLLRAAVEAHRGTVVGGRGDGLFAVFRSPRDGVRAALDGQRAIAATAWSEGIELRVRMGVHAGEATERDGDWFGTEVNRAARVMSVAHGGQVLCTRIVEELVRDECDLVDLGEHRLRDLQSAMHLFQVEIPGAPAAHPALRSIDAHLTNLPYQLSNFIGREEEQHEVAERVAASRLVSIVGVGGVGKTRLALQVAATVLPEHEDGVWLCELADVSDPDDLHEAIAAALRYTPAPGVPVPVGLQQHLEHKRLLLVLDNCEHLVGAVASFVTDTTTRAASVSILVTSREALGVRGEQIFPLQSLELPSTSDLDAVLDSEAGALFVARAREARGTLVLDDRSAAAIRSLCARLDGIPLALELAAAQAALMTPAEIERRIDRQFRTATGGRHAALERHQTLRAAIDWSYELLTPSAQVLLQRLSVCVGGFDLDAAIAFATDIESADADGFDLLSELVAKSLVERYEVNANTRYRLLEMIRQYAAEQLAATGGVAATRDVHADHYSARLVELGRQVSSENEYEALDLLELEAPNVAGAFEWWLATDRSSNVLLCFDRMPFFDYFAAPAVILEELTPIVLAAIDEPDAEHRPGFDAACMFACFQGFIHGDIDGYRQLMTRANAGGETVSGNVTASMSAMFTGDLDTAARHAAAAAELARPREPQLLAWTLAHWSTLACASEQWKDDEVNLLPRTSERAEAALRAAHATQGTIARQYPLLSIVTARLGIVNYSKGTAPAEGLAAADELVAIDRTQRRFWSTTAASASASARASVGAIDDQLSEWRRLLVHYEERDEPFMYVMLLGVVCEVLARDEPAAAVSLAAIAEAGAIAPTAAFGTFPALIQRAAERPDAAAAARAHAAGLSRVEAYEEVVAQLDTVLAARATPPSAT